MVTTTKNAVKECVRMCLARLLRNGDLRLSKASTTSGGSAERFLTGIIRC